MNAWKEERDEENENAGHLSCVKYDSSEVFVFSGGEVVKALVYALVVHLQIEIVKTTFPGLAQCPPDNISGQGWSSRAGS